MRADLRLGLRLAWGAGARERLRGAGVVLTAAVGGWLLLGTLAAARSEWDQGFTVYGAGGMRNLLLSVVAVVAMSVAVLVASAARLSAGVRDRRLAVLRLLGLAPARTRVVAAVEAGAGASAGSLLGLASFWLTRPLTSQLQVAGADWSGTSFAPWPLSTIGVVVVAVPAVAVAVALLPTRTLRRDLLPASRLASSRRPSPWRLLPLAVGLALTTVDLTSGDHITDLRVVSFLAGAVLCGVGVLLVLPVLTRLLGDLLVRVPAGAALRIAGRRLQAQPAGVSRVVAGLLVGLFLVTGGRMVIGAFEDTPAYVSTAAAVEDGRVPYEVLLPRGVDPEAAADTLAGVDGARGAYIARMLQTSCGRTAPCETAFVGSCADLAVAVPGTTGCRDDTAAWLGGGAAVGAAAGADLVWRGDGQQLTLPRPDTTIGIPAVAPLIDRAGLSVFLPASTPGVLDLVAPASAHVVVVLDLDQGSRHALQAAAAEIATGARVYPQFSIDDYQFVAGLRTLVWAIAFVVLGVGLLGFVVTAVDRALSRRAEMVSLQLIGTPRRVIRAAQWWEAAVPLAVGMQLAVLLGWAVGSGYLALGGALDARPWQSVFGLAGFSAAAGVVASGLTVLACAPRVRADLVRRT